jgi:phosphoenolpyruvate---glycerone phosphotransferase subunit DhaK
MRKLLNDPFAVVDEMLEGVLVAHGDTLAATPCGRGLVLRTLSPARRTGIVTGGGSGHEPAFWGYVGPGLADGAAAGNVFAAPSATPIVEAARAVDRGGGVLFVYGTYDGDVMNFETAAELLEEDGIATLTCTVSDDIASAPPERRLERRGVAGGVLVLKAAGARADEGVSLEELAALAAHANERTRTIGVALGPCTVPAAGRPTFELPEGELDLGMGIHGEAGVYRGPLVSADELADTLVDRLLADRPAAGGEPLLVLVNGLGATPVMECFVVLRRVAALLEAEGLRIHRALVGEYVTSLEMTGLSVTLMHLDEELRRLVDAPGQPVAAPPLVP